MNLYHKDTKNISNSVLSYIGAEEIIVHQGNFLTKGGYIYTYLNTVDNDLYIGGNYIKILEGDLLDNNGKVTTSH